MKRIFVDCTHTYDNKDLNTGIQRVVRNAINKLPIIAGTNVEVIPIRVERGIVTPVSLEMTSSNKMEIPFEVAKTSPRIGKKILFNFRLLLSRLLLGKCRAFLIGSRYQKGTLSNILYDIYVFITTSQNLRASQKYLQFGSGDVLLLIDASWHLNIWPFVKKFRKEGGIAIGICYDLIPIKFPQFCDSYHITVFQQWVNNSARYLDGYIAISESVKNELDQHLSESFDQNIVRNKMLGFFHLGSDFHVPLGGLSSLTLEKIFAKNKKVFLTVCTIEPRKNHEQILNAAESLWREGHDFSILFIGKVGWKIDTFLKRMTSHSEYNKRLYLISGASDSDLAYAYRSASSLIFASITEGFGLPIIEAQKFGLPVIASDIPVHREVAGEGTQFFLLNDVPDLADKMREKLESKSLERVERDYSLSWNDSIAWLYKEIQKIFNQRTKMQ